jgi:hypothetical protein
MNIPRACLTGAVLGSMLAADGCVSAVKTAPKDDSVQAKVYRSLVAASVVDNWPPISAQAARRLIEQYGVPDAVRGDRLTWRDNGPWKRTVVRDVTPPYVQAEDLGVVEQTVAYSMSSREAADLAAFDRRLDYDPGRGELSARSDREESNYLRLNLANDIVNRRMTPEQARDLYAQILRLEAAGKSSSYLQVLHFPHPSE